MKCSDLLTVVLLVEEEMPGTWAPALRRLVSAFLRSVGYLWISDRRAEVLLHATHCIHRRHISAVWTVGVAEAHL